MSYNYHYDIATSRTKVILKLLCRWRGSVWEAVYIELLIWLFIYACISLIYRLALTPDQQGSFERFALFCDKRLAYIPLNFMLSFFVTTVVNRWITQFANLGMIDNIALFTSTYVKGSDERARQLRRNIVRYCCLSQALVFRDIHLGVRKRFPTLDTLVAAGFMQKHEQEKFDECKSRYAKYWLPFNWSLHLLNISMNEGRIDGEISHNAIAQEIRNFRSGLSLIWTYDWVPLPIMYPQLIYLAVHTYFLICLFSRQFIIRPEAVNQTEIDLYFPFMSTLEFIFYMGWLKVAMALLNPFGEDEDDFDCNFLLDRNLTISLTCVDDAFDDLPLVKPDVFYNDTVSPLYSKETAQRNVNFYLGSASRAEIPEQVTEIEMVPHPINERFDHYIQRPQRRRRTSIVSVLKVPKSARRNESFSSQVANVFRNRKNSSNSALDAQFINSRARSSTDVVQRKTFDPVEENGNCAYNNPTFIHVEEAEDIQNDNNMSTSYTEENQKSIMKTQGQHLGGNVRSHIRSQKSAKEEEDRPGPEDKY